MELSKAHCTDYWKSYKEFIPAEKHLQTKKKLILLKVTTAEFGII
ncbi:hypothetical protein CCAND38_80087 [Capnocytophaga canis]|uniref:Uncharacterized protein n=1 Tax=Capnocytophaga canis TaxID=1848903 RepID=A0A0B7IBR8_9FLAO|nr:hypothetical protein CCAND38_80087 [Capnocytophaga canis]